MNVSSEVSVYMDACIYGPAVSVHTCVNVPECLIHVCSHVFEQACLIVLVQGWVSASSAQCLPGGQNLVL